MPLQAWDWGWACLHAQQAPLLRPRNQGMPGQVLQEQALQHLLQHLDRLQHLWQPRNQKLMNLSKSACCATRCSRQE